MKHLKTINWLIIIVLVGLDIYHLLNVVQTGTNDRIGTVLVLLPLLFLPVILRKVFHLEIKPFLEFLYLIFIFLAQYLGSVVNLYAKIEWFDMFTHFLSGIATSLLALFLLVRFRHYHSRQLLFQIVFILGIAFLVAGLWEFYEFGLDQFTGSNLQHAMETGVRDTMEDLLVAFGGSILFIIEYSFEVLADKKGIGRHFIEAVE